MSTKLKYLVYGLSALVVCIIAAVVYRMFFQFNWTEIDVYAKEEAEKYPDKAAAYRLIIDGVENILSSHKKTQQVLTSARATKTDREQELVNAAINQCYAYNYFARKA
jgi:hypothetical protein